MNNELKEKYQINLKAIDDISKLLKDYSIQIDNLSKHLQMIKSNIENIELVL